MLATPSSVAWTSRRGEGASVSDLSRLYWTLCALGCTVEAQRLRAVAEVARDGDPGARARLEALQAELGWALQSLGASDEARRLREAASAARAGDPEALAHLDLVRARWKAGLAGTEPPEPAEADAADERAPEAAEATSASEAAEPEASRAGTPLTPVPRRFTVSDERGLSPVSPRSVRRRAVAAALLATAAAVAVAAWAVPDSLLATARRWSSQGRDQAGQVLRRVTSAFGELAHGLMNRGQTPEPAPASPGSPSLAPRPAATRPARGPASTAGSPDAGAGEDAASGTARGAGGALPWSAASWAMTIDDVVAAFPGATRLEVARRDEDGLAPSARAQLRLGGRSYRAEFLFDRAGRLGVIQLRSAEAESGRTPAYDQLLAALSAEYGKPQSERRGDAAAGAWQPRAAWSTPDGLVELRGEELEPRQARLVSVDLAAGDVRPVTGRLVVLTVRPPAASR
jgi:hypothetical protein